MVSRYHNFAIVRFASLPRNLATTATKSNEHQPPTATNSQANNNNNNQNTNQLHNNNSHQEQDLTEQRIHEIFRELNRLQTEQAGLLQELQDLTDSTDPPGVEWIYPDPNPETQHSR